MMILLLRHAERIKNSTQDELSDFGYHQAQKLYEKISPFFVPKNLYSSPKKRCLETLLPLSRKLKLPISILDALDEGGDSYSKAEFVSKYIFQDTIFCSHSDILPSLYLNLNPNGKELSFAPAGGVLLNLEGFNIIHQF